MSFKFESNYKCLNPGSWVSVRVEGSDSWFLKFVSTSKISCSFQDLSVNLLIHYAMWFLSLSPRFSFS